MSEDPTMRAERAHLRRAARCLGLMRARVSDIVDGDVGVDAAATEALARMREARLQALGTDGDGPPFFARIDCDPNDHDADNDHNDHAEVFHLGRRHIRDAHGDAVVVDWRVPIARAFYQATATNRMGVRLRRRFGFHDGELSSYEDEHLDEGKSLGLASTVLREEIERPRVGPMRDIVATIQPDQDDLVRADLDRSLCVQGAPGTGKTAVGLHRAAYLLYTYPERLRRSGVLVVGPNDAFLHYTAQVLPTLGEGGIAQMTVTELVRGSRTPVAEDAERATLKGDPRLADVLRRAVLANIGAPREDLVVTVGSRRHRIPESRLRRYAEEGRDTDARWSASRDRISHRIASDVRRQVESGGGSVSDAQMTKIARSATVRRFVDVVRPVLSPDVLLARLYSERDFLDECAKGTLSEEELALLSWTKPAKSPRSAPWTTADLVLRDELRGLIDATPTYVHIVVDEAQDLSAMECRVIARRCPLGSVTVLGDLAQATTPWAPGSWRATLGHLGHDDAEVLPLTAGYRVPRPILELANRLLPHIAAEVPPATSVRTGTNALSFARFEELIDTVRSTALLEGSVGVIVADAMADEVQQALRRAGVVTNLVEVNTDHGVAIVPASAAKGMEYDSVVLVEPAAIVAMEKRRADGLRRLYVSLTRAVSRMVVVHDQPLPAELRHQGSVPQETQRTG